MRRTSFTGAAVRLAIAVAVVAATGCVGGGEIRYVGAANPCAPRSGEPPAKALVRCSAHSVVYVETDEGTGTGVAIEHDGRRYIVTNCHVVDPFGSVAVSLDGERHTDIDVVGVDAGADIAVLGPLDDDFETRPLPIGVAARPERGDEVFLVGYPGESPPDDPAELETTIAGGIVSRLREVRAFDQTYVQTDASIAGGQSGGPLFDAYGDLVGISGLGFADEFALALSATDVDDAVQRILDGDGDDYAAVPTHETDEMLTEGSVTFADALDGQVLFIPAADEDRTLDFSFDGDPDTVVTMTSNQADMPLAVSSNSDDVYARLDQLIEDASALADGEAPDPGFEEDFGFEEDPGYEEELTPEEEDAAKAEVSPGVFHVELEADHDLTISLSVPLLSHPLTVPFRSSLAVWPLTSERSEQDLEVGDSVDRVIGRFDTGSDYLVDLEPGQRVLLSAQSAAADVAMYVFDPGIRVEPVVLNDPEAMDGIEFVDDTEGGLYGLDASTVIGSDDGGVYRVRLMANDFLTVLARLTVTDCDDVECD